MFLLKDFRKWIDEILGNLKEQPQDEAALSFF